MATMKKTLLQRLLRQRLLLVFFDLLAPKELKVYGSLKSNLRSGRVPYHLSGKRLRFEISLQGIFSLAFRHTLHCLSFEDQGSRYGV